MENIIKQKEKKILQLEADLQIAHETIAIKMKSLQNCQQQVSIVQIPLSQSEYSFNENQSKLSQKQKCNIIESELKQYQSFKQSLNPIQFKFNLKEIQHSKQQILQFLAQSVKNGTLLASSLKLQMLTPLIEEVNENGNLKATIIQKNNQITLLKKMLFEKDKFNLNFNIKNQRKYSYPFIQNKSQINDFLSSVGKKKKFIQDSQSDFNKNKSIQSNELLAQAELIIQNLKQEILSKQQLFYSVLNQRNEQVQKFKKQISHKQHTIKTLQLHISQLNQRNFGQGGIEQNTFSEVKKFKQSLCQIMVETQKKISKLNNQNQNLNQIIKKSITKSIAIFLVLGCQGKTQNTKNGLIKMLQAIHQKVLKIDSSPAIKNKNKQFLIDEMKMKVQQNLEKVDNFRVPKSTVHQRMIANNKIIPTITIPKNIKCENKINQRTLLQVQDTQQNFFQLRKTSEGAKQIRKSERAHDDSNNQAYSRMANSQMAQWSSSNLRSTKKQKESSYVKKMENFLQTKKDALQKQSKKLQQKYQNKKKKVKNQLSSIDKSMQLGQILQSVVDQQEDLYYGQLFSPLKRRQSMLTSKLIPLSPKSLKITNNSTRFGNHNEQIFQTLAYLRTSAKKSHFIDKPNLSSINRQRKRSKESISQVSQIISQQASISQQDSQQKMKQDFNPKNLKQLSCKQSFKEEGSLSNNENRLPDKLQLGEDEKQQFRIAITGPNKNSNQPIKTESFFLSLRQSRRNNNDQRLKQATTRERQQQQLRLSYNRNY